MNSKKVFIRRQDLGGHLPKAVRAEATYKLSSVYVNRQPLKGFNSEDEKKYLNGILDVNPEHGDWPKHSKTFWADMTIPVGFTGVELEIGKDTDGNPISIMDYIKYSFAMKHPHVALTKEEMAADVTKKFYIQDLTRQDKVRNNEIQIRKDADKEFIKVTSSSENMKRILRLMSNTNPDRMSGDQVENALYEIKNSDPKKFVKIATDKNLELKSEIAELVSAGVLRQIGNQLIFIDEIIGDTIDDAIIHLKDKKNSGKLIILRAKLRELSLA